MTKRAFFEMSPTDEEYVRNRLNHANTFMSPDTFEPDHISRFGDCEVLSVFIRSKLDQSIGLQGFDLRNRTIGVVGTGHIGVHVVRIARGFMMKVIAYDVRPDKRLADALDFVYLDTLEELLGASDIVTLHSPLLPSTHHMINSQTIYQMKKGALLINTARGGLIDTDALLAALSSGHLGGAGLDVFEGETLIQEEKQLLSNDYNVEELRTLVKNLTLFRHENVIVTPHVAFNSNESLERILLTTIQNIVAFEAGKPINVVT